MAITVRRATPEDAETVAHFAIRLSEQHREYDPKRFVALGDSEGATWFYGGQTETEGSAILIAENDGTAVGFAFLQYEAKNYAELLEDAALLQDIYVVESARHSGAGKKLVEAAVQVAKELGANKLMLHVAEKNDIAQEFFLQAGFRTTMLEMMLEITG